MTGVRAGYEKVGIKFGAAASIVRGTYQGGSMGKLIEFLQVPEAAGSHPHGESIRAGKGCEHRRLVFKNELIECRACGRQWRDYGIGAKK